MISETLRASPHYARDFRVSIAYANRHPGVVPRRRKPCQMAVQAGVLALTVEHQGRSRLQCLLDEFHGRRRIATDNKVGRTRRLAPVRVLLAITSVQEVETRVKGGR